MVHLLWLCSEAIAQKEGYLAELNGVISRLEDSGFEPGRQPPPLKRELARVAEDTNRHLEVDLANARRRSVESREGWGFDMMGE